MLQLKPIKPLVGALLCCICAPSLAQTTTPTYPLPVEKYPYENLLSKNELAREDAYSRILCANSTLDLILMQNFETLMEERPKDIDGYGKLFAITIRLMGDLRVAKAQGRLLDIIDYQIDPTSIPPSTCIFDNAYTYYPAAFALSQIGDKKIMINVWGELAHPASDTRLRLYTYVLREMLGKNITILVADQKLTKENERLKLVNETTSDMKTNLETLKSLLKSEKLLVDAPKTRMARPQALAP